MSVRSVRRAPRALFAWASLLLATACHGGEGGGKGAAWLTADVKPTNVRLTLDTANAVSEVVTPRGATLAAAGEDGTFFTLTIPKGALRANQRITMIPIRKVDGLPLKDGARAAVQLEPEGLRLLKPATLTIEVAQHVATAEQVAFAYVGRGSDVHLYPAGGDSLQTELELLHFSGYGFGKAPPGDPGVEMLQHAAAQEARLEARAAAVIQEAKARKGDEVTLADYAPQLEAIAIEYYDTIIRPLMQVAETDDRMAECALQQFFGWDRTLQLLGLAGGDDESAGATSALEQRRRAGYASVSVIFRNAADQALPRADKACREQHDLTAYERVIGIMREMQLLGIDGGPAFADVMKRIEACGQFELELVSVIVNKTPSGTSVYHVASTVPVRNLEPGAQEATPLRYVEYSASGRPKEDLFGKYVGPTGDADDLGQAMARMLELGNVEMSAAGTRPGTIRVLGIDWETNTIDTVGTSCAGTDEKQKALAVDSIFRVTLQIETPTELTRFTPIHRELGARPFTEEMHEWMRFFRQFHRTALASQPSMSEVMEADEVPATEVLVLELKRQSPGVWRAELQTPDRGAVPGFSLTESGHVVLRHAPR